MVQTGATQAKAALKVLFYKRENFLPFATFTSRMKKAYNTLSICDPPGVSDATQVEELCSKISTQNTMLQAVIAGIRMNPARFHNFTAAATQISMQLAVIFSSQSAQGPGRHRKRHAMTA